VISRANDGGDGVMAELLRLRRPGIARNPPELKSVGIVLPRFLLTLLLTSGAHRRRYLSAPLRWMRLLTSVDGTRVRRRDYTPWMEPAPRCSSPRSTRCAASRRQVDWGASGRPPPSSSSPPAR